MNTEILKTIEGSHNLKSYETQCQEFNWKEVENNFSWYKTGRMNMAYEAIDRHAESDMRDKTALIFEDELREEKFSFDEMKTITNQAGNLLREFADVKKGDHVFLFIPRSPELYFMLLGAIKIGAVVGPLFEAFMTEALKDRLEDSKAKVLITTTELLNRVPISELPDLKSIILIGDNIKEQGPYIDYKHIHHMSKELEIEWMDRNDGMLMHYTSGTTGKAKGVVHVHNAMIQHYQTAKWVLDLQKDDIYWCTADPGWVTGTSYGIFAPWLTGTTNIILGGRFKPERWYETLEKYNVTVWYSAPTAFRMLMSAGDELVGKYDLHSLRHIASVGEPLNPEIIRWGIKVFHLRIHDTWWMTETGAQLICNYPSMDIKLGSMGKPIPGVEAAIVDDKGNVVPPNTLGNLAVKKGWPSMMAQIWNNAEKYNSYFIKDWYVSGDTAYMDEDGYFWFQGRIDDVIMTAGERIGPFEVESSLLEHPAVAEAGVIGKPDSIRGEIVKAFVVLSQNYTNNIHLEEELKRYVKNNLAAHAAPREIQFIDTLPKTRSGKIMRRVLKAWELNLPVGDLSTMEN